jgi:cysteine-rich repeat protein
VTRAPARAGGRRGPRHLFHLRAALVAIALAAAALAASPSRLQAHGTPASLDVWGAPDFGRHTARCQRLIARSAAVCALRSWEIRRDCWLGALHGTPCDRQAATDAIEPLRIAAFDAVTAACTDPQAIILRFVNEFEAGSDVVAFCRYLDTAAESAAFLPILADPDGASAPTPACVEAAARATTKLLRRSFDSRQHVLDRIALITIPAPTKRTMVENSTEAIARDAATLAATLGEGCSAADFAQVYGRDPTTFLAQIASRADCLAGQTYSQDGVLCPDPQCGNGMVEKPAEDCDDGNLVAGDGCDAGCEDE